MDNKISEIIGTAADKAIYALKENSVFGDPITVDGAMIIPVFSLSFGFGGGAFDGADKKKDDSVAGGAGAGVTKKPVSYIVVKDGEVSVLSAGDSEKNGIVDKVFQFIKYRGKKQ
ncbi:MAG: sporulation protein YtfJ [Ruminococcaceae bacterium]|nr:sporulation protein YtfJ [Oscillospiraceae bacterium]